MRGYILGLILGVHHGITRYPFYTTSPKTRFKLALISVSCSSFWDGGGIEGGILEAHESKGSMSKGFPMGSCLL